MGDNPLRPVLIVIALTIGLGGGAALFMWGVTGMEGAIADAFEGHDAYKAECKERCAPYRPILSSGDCWFKAPDGTEQLCPALISPEEKECAAMCAPVKSSVDKKGLCICKPFSSTDDV